MNALQSKADRDRLRGRAAGNKAMLDAVRVILRGYRQGRAASACMADIEQLVGGAEKLKRNMDIPAAGSRP